MEATATRLIPLGHGNNKLRKTEFVGDDLLPRDIGAGTRAGIGTVSAASARVARVATTAAAENLVEEALLAFLVDAGFVRVALRQLALDAATVFNGRHRRRGSHTRTGSLALMLVLLLLLVVVRRDRHTADGRQGPHSGDGSGSDARNAESGRRSAGVRLVVALTDSGRVRFHAVGVRVRRRQRRTRRGSSRRGRPHRRRTNRSSRSDDGP